MLPNFFTWLPLPQLPRVPEHFIQRAKTIASEAEVNQDKMVTLNQGYVTTDFFNRKIQKNGSLINTRHQEAFFMGTDWEQWAKENIFANFFETTVRVNLGNSNTHGPHVDNPGRIRFYYLIERGGEDAETVFYHKPGDPIIYNADENTKRNIHCNNVDELIVLDRAKFPLHTWILFNGYIMHGVENISTTGAPRLNLTLDCKPDSFNFSVLAR